MAQSRGGGSRGGTGRSGARAKSAGTGAGRASGTPSRGSAAKASGSRKGASRSAAKSSPKRGASARGAGSRSTTSRSAGSRSATSRSAGSRSTTSRSAGSRSTTSRSAAAKKGGQTRARKSTARKSTARKSTARKSSSARKASSGATAAHGSRQAGVEAKTVAEFRAALRKNLMKPRNMVLLSRDRIEEVLGEAVDQGRINARDAQRITSGLVKRGQAQTSDVMKDLESLLDRGTGAAKGARGRAVRRASPALKQVDKVRRGAGVGASFPITGYDDLKAAQVQSRLADLTPAQLRKVRDHESRNAKRKTVLNAIASRLR